MAQGDGYKHFKHHVCHYDMGDFLPSAYEVAKKLKASNPSAASPSCVLATYKDSQEDEEAFKHDQGSDNNNIEVNCNRVAPLELQCYWESCEEDDSPKQANETRSKRDNSALESSSLDTIDEVEDEGIKVDDDDDIHGTSNNTL